MHDNNCNWKEGEMSRIHWLLQARSPTWCRLRIKLPYPNECQMHQALNFSVVTPVHEIKLYINEKEEWFYHGDCTLWKKKKKEIFRTSKILEKEGWLSGNCQALEAFGRLKAIYPQHEWTLWQWINGQKGFVGKFLKCILTGYPRYMHSNRWVLAPNPDYLPVIPILDQMKLIWSRSCPP